MEVKKSPQADLQTKRRTFLLIGLIVALGSMIALFSWSQSEKIIDIAQGSGEIVDIDVIDVTVVDQPKPEPVKIETAVSDILKIVKDNTKITQQVNIFDEDALANIDSYQFKVIEKTEEAVDEDIPVLVAEEMPTFQGKDLNAFRSWCASNLVYPSIAAENGVQGRVHLSFVVERDGSVSNITVQRSSNDRDLDAAAVKVVAKSPKWAPGKNRGKPVRFNYRMPIDFILTN